MSSLGRRCASGFMHCTVLTVDGVGVRLSLSSPSSTKTGERIELVFGMGGFLCPIVVRLRKVG